MSTSPQCCCCPPKDQKTAASGGLAADTMNLPVLCLIPRNPQEGADKHRQHAYANQKHLPVNHSDNFELMDEEYLKKHFNLPKRALYLDPKRRPLITFPMTQEDSKHFNLARKYKINQQILDGILDPSAAITAQSVFPYAHEAASSKTSMGTDIDDDEFIYIVQLPDYESKCPVPVHHETITTPRFIWHACKHPKSKSSEKKSHNGLLSGPPKRPKPWLLSRHTDFDLLSQW